MPFRSVMRVSFPSRPGSSIETRRHAPISFSLAEPSFCADWASESPLSAATAASVQPNSAFMLDSFRQYLRPPGCRSPARQLFMEFRIPSPFELDLRGGTFDSAEIFRCKSDVRRPEIFFQAMQLGCARNRNDPRFLGQKPGERDLSRCCLLLFRESGEQINQGLIRFTI